jgi:hypothetical protein
MISEGTALYDQRHHHPLGASIVEQSYQCQACGSVLPVKNLTAFHSEPDVTDYVCTDWTACKRRQDDIHARAGLQPRDSRQTPRLSLPDVVPTERLRAKLDLGAAAGKAAHLRDLVDRWDMEDPDRQVFQRELRYIEETCRHEVGQRQPAVHDVPDAVSATVARLDQRVSNLEGVVFTQGSARPLSEVVQLGPIRK